MEGHVFLAVLAAALCHAGWNASLKLRLEPAVAITLISVAAGIVALPLLPFVGIPHQKSWPFLAVSLAVHLFYYIYLAEAYRTGDLGQVYPIARGAAPMLTAIGGLLVYSDPLGAMAWAGIGLLTAGIALLSIKGGRVVGSIDRRAVGFAFATAVSIAAYTLVDGQGARHSGNAHAYAVMLFVLDGVMMALYGWLRQRDAMGAALPRTGLLVVGGGLLSLISYWIAIWAMTVAPIALVAAVRETSVLFAALIGVLVLKEPLVAVRVVSALIVVAGLALIRLAS